MQGERVTCSPPWISSRAADLLPSPSLVRGDPTLGWFAASQNVLLSESKWGPQAEIGRWPMPREEKE